MSALGARNRSFDTIGTEKRRKPRTCIYHVALQLEQLKAKPSASFDAEIL